MISGSGGREEAMVHSLSEFRVFCKALGIRDFRAIHGVHPGFWIDGNTVAPRAMRRVPELDVSLSGSQSIVLPLPLTLRPRRGTF